MSILIEELKKEHSQILDSLKEVRELGILSYEGQDKLISLELGLLAHLEMEDDLLYPALRKEAEHSNSMKDILELFTIDMESVSKIVREFFEKYSEGFSGVELDKLSEDFDNLFSVLTKRICDEEETLYEEYEALDRTDRS